MSRKINDEDIMAGIQTIEFLESPEIKNELTPTQKLEQAMKLANLMGRVFLNMANSTRPEKDEEEIATLLDMAKSMAKFRTASADWDYTEEEMEETYDLVLKMTKKFLNNFIKEH